MYLIQNVYSEQSTNDRKRGKVNIRKGQTIKNGRAKKPRYYSMCGSRERGAHDLGEAVHGASEGPNTALCLNNDVFGAPWALNLDSSHQSTFHCFFHYLLLVGRTSDLGPTTQVP